MQRVPAAHILAAWSTRGANFGPDAATLIGEPPPFSYNRLNKETRASADPSQENSFAHIHHIHNGNVR